MVASKRKSRSRSRLTHKEIYLDKHDEEKVLLFTAGMLFGVGVAASLFSSTLWYGGLVAIALAAVLLLVEKRQ